MAVDGQDGDEDQIDPVQQVGLAVEGDVAEQHHARVLAVDLAGVDAGLGQQHGLGRVEGRAVLRGDHGIDGPALGRDTELFDADKVRGGVQPVEPGTGVGVVRAFVVLGVRLEGRDPGVGGVAQQRPAGPVPGRCGRQEGLVPGGGIGDGRRLGHGGARNQKGTKNNGDEGQAHGGHSSNISRSVASRVVKSTICKLPILRIIRVRSTERILSGNRGSDRAQRRRAGRSEAQAFGLPVPMIAF